MLKGIKGVKGAAREHPPLNGNGRKTTPIKDVNKLSFPNTTTDTGNGVAADGAGRAGLKLNWIKIDMEAGQHELWPNPTCCSYVNTHTHTHTHIFAPLNTFAVRRGPRGN